jgi:hypothetical protein
MLQPIAEELFNLCGWTIFVQICASGRLSATTSATNSSATV